MEAENQSTTPETNFTDTQSQLLGTLRARYQQDRDLFTGRELSHLRFMRWLQEQHVMGEDFDVVDSGQIPMLADDMPVGPDTGGTPRCAA